MNEREKLFDHILAINCVRDALRRHAGTLTEIYLPKEKFWVQRGKNLTKVVSLVGTDGGLVFAGDPEPLLIDELRLDGPFSLTPHQPQLILDHRRCTGDGSCCILF